MADQIAQALVQAAHLTAAACRAARAEGTLSGELPAGPGAVWGGDFADCSTAYPLAAARALRRPARELAELLAVRIALGGTFFASVEAAGPGFLNFRLADVWYEKVLAAADGLPGTAAKRAPPPLPDREAIRLLLGAEPDAEIDPELPLRRDRGNPVYRLRYALQRLRRLPEAAEREAELPFSPSEKALIKAIAACLPIGTEPDLRPAARSLTALADALHAYHTACRRAGCAPRRRTLIAARQALEIGMGTLGVP